MITDGSGNPSSCDTYFLVKDTTKPTLTCGSGQFTNANESCIALVPDFVATSTSSDNCVSPTVNQSIAYQAAVGKGSHQITVASYDGSGNYNECQVVFDVYDVTAPVINECAAPITVNADEFCNAFVPDFKTPTNAEDACGAFYTDQYPVEDAVLTKGSYPVTIVTTDLSGNANNCTTTFHVVDVTPPVIVSCAPSQIHVPADPTTCLYSVIDLVSLSSFYDTCDCIL
jgi:hypothetical protein